MDIQFRSYDVNDVIDFKCRTQYFKNSYFARVVRKWNSLDSDIKTMTALIFLSQNFIRNFIVNLMLTNSHINNLYLLLFFSL